MAFRLRLHHRIVIPFAVVALAATSASAFLALSVISRAFEDRMLTQVLNTADVISRGGFAFNLAILRSVKTLVGVDVITFDDGGAILSSTLDVEGSEVVRTVTAAPLADEARAAGSLGVVREITCYELPCFVSYRPVVDRPGVMVAVVMQSGETEAAVRAVARTIFLTAILGLAALILVSQVVARRVTAPLEQLVRFSQQVGDGSTLRAAVGDDEVGRLGRAFNQMLDRLDESKIAMVRNEKLALAGLFAARVAHDIRNPLSAIKMQTQLLRARFGAAADRQSVAMLEAVHRDILQVESVVQDLLDLARPGELKRAPVGLGTVVDDALEHVAPHLAYRKIQIQKQVDPRLPPIPLDASRFKHALLNIIGNAADAMPTGGTLTVTATMQTDAADLRLDVVDTGSGIDPALLPNVFDPFVSSKRDGIGLGLVNAKAVVEGHGGRIEVAPVPSGGTRVSMWLPIAGAAARG